jgi:hypothetical protein
MSNRFDPTHKLASKQDATTDALAGVRNDVVTGGGRRRRWSSDDKARIVRESMKPGALVSEVAQSPSPPPLDRPVKRVNWPRVTFAGLLAGTVTILLTLGFKATTERLASARSCLRCERETTSCILEQAAIHASLGLRFCDGFGLSEEFGQDWFGPAKIAPRLA